MSIPFPSKYTPTISLTDDEYEEYLGIISDVDLYTYEFKSEMLNQFLKNHNIDRYVFNDVIKYLNDQFNNRWEFYGIRSSDLQYSKNRYYSEEVAGRKITYSNNLYTRKIPINVIEKIQNLKDELPFLYFYITDDETVTDHEFSFLFVGLEHRMFPILHWKKLTLKEVPLS